MEPDSVEDPLVQARNRVALLEAELADTNQGLLALSIEVERKGEELRSMTEHLWQSAKLAAVGELAASIAHELNNPLATVSMRLEMLLEQTPSDDPRLRSYGVMHRECGRMAGLVTNLLQFSRRHAPALVPVDLSSEITQTEELIHFHLAKRNVTVLNDLPPLPRVLADAQHLRQVFLNLFTNAADAMPAGGPVTVRGEALEGGYVAAEVEDSGVGIPPENLDRVLQAFFTTKPVGKGTGLGLPICRRIIEEHGGTLSLRSEVGRGTVIRMVLPAAPA